MAQAREDMFWLSLAFMKLLYFRVFQHVALRCFQVSVNKDALSLALGGKASEEPGAQGTAIASCITIILGHMQAYLFTHECIPYEHCMRVTRWKQNMRSNQNTRVGLLLCSWPAHRSATPSPSNRWSK